MMVSELEGASLDYWVAKAEGERVEMEGGHAYVFLRCGFADGDVIAEEAGYSRFWDEGGPIIERELGDISHVDMIGDGNKWHAFMGVGHRRYRAFGPTPLIAAMRAYVGLRFGAEVPDIGGDGE